MDLELSDEQRWLSESVESLLTRHREAPREVLWQHLAEFGALAVRRGRARARSSCA